jgi:hypothetical protein
MIRAVLLLLCLFGGVASSTAAEVSSKDSAAIRAVIREQLDALARDDAVRAFALATSGIRARFGTPRAFMDMVRSQYAVVYRPQRVDFDKPVTIEGQVMQPVRLLDAKGEPWLALYPMQRQRDGSWRIDGCQLARLEAQRT